jgi:hypothetical protein
VLAARRMSGLRVVCEQQGGVGWCWTSFLLRLDGARRQRPEALPVQIPEARISHAQP